LKIPEFMMEEMIAHARETYPAEACGIITGTSGGLTVLTRCRNVQDELHAEDPELHPRTSRDGFSVDPIEMLQIMRAARERGEDFKIIYHSHVDADAYFSEEDKRVATWEGEPTYPGVGYIVISVYGGEPKSANLFHWSEEKGDFEGVSLEVK